MNRCVVPAVHSIGGHGIASEENTMKSLMIAMMISGVTLMAQSTSAPASSSNPGSTGTTNTAPATKVKKHHKAKTATSDNKPATSTSNDANSKPAAK